MPWFTKGKNSDGADESYFGSRRDDSDLAARDSGARHHPGTDGRHQSGACRLDGRRRLHGAVIRESRQRFRRRGHRRDHRGRGDTAALWPRHRRHDPRNLGRVADPDSVDFVDFRPRAGRPAGADPRWHRRGRDRLSRLSPVSGRGRGGDGAGAGGGDALHPTRLDRAHGDDQRGAGARRRHRHGAGSPAYLHHRRRHRRCGGRADRADAGPVAAVWRGVPRAGLSRRADRGAQPCRPRRRLDSPGSDAGAGHALRQSGLRRRRRHRRRGGDSATLACRLHLAPRMSARRRDFILIGSALIVVIAAVPFLGNEYRTQLWTQAFTFAIAAVSLDLVWGYTGIPDLGHSVWFGIGALTVGLMTTTVSDTGLVLESGGTAGTYILAIAVGTVAAA